MKRRDVEELGVPTRCVPQALAAFGRAMSAKQTKAQVKQRIADVCSEPDAYVLDPVFGSLASEIADLRAKQATPWTEREAPAPHASWSPALDAGSQQQINDACRLPVAVRAALMPDAHTGYGLPIGGVLATHNAVIPYGVGVDISCAMNLTVTDIPVANLKGERERLINVLERETAFGMGASFGQRPREHAVLDSTAWDDVHVVRAQKDKAWRQLGSSGGGNHFVEYGVVSVPEGEHTLGLDAGEYVAIMSHSGSRGPGATLASHYTALAKEEHPELPPELRHLAWLDLDSDAGREYWLAMTLMGEFAEACHRVIHREMLRSLGAKPLANVFNRHNFAWLEEHDGQTVVVHRKGATPAEEGQLGIIPGSMADPAFVVRGKGNEAALRSASHGAGRRMSRNAARRSVDRAAIRKMLAERDVTVVSAGWDENPLAYKDIEEVMDLQTDLVDTVARFDPKIVKMAPGGEQKKWEKYARATLTNLTRG